MAATIGVCVSPEPAKNAPRTVQHGAYIHEILGHAGLCCDTLDSEAAKTENLKAENLKAENAPRFS